MKLITRILTALLALSMLVSFVACANNEEEDVTTAGDNDDAVTTVAEKETTPEEALEFDFKEFSDDFTFAAQDGTYGWGTVDIYVEEKDSAEPIESAIFNRNLWIKDTFGCTVKQTLVPSIGTTANSMVKAGTNDFDAYASKTNEAANISLKNCLYDLVGGDLPYLNLEHSWWDGRTASGLSINGKLYFATGDLFTIDNSGTYILMFNKKLLNDHMATGEIEGTPYDYVNNMEWTFDIFTKMANLTVKGDGKTDPEWYKKDSFGLAGGCEMVLAFFYSSGQTTAKIDESGDISFGIDTLKADEYFGWAHDFLYGQSTLIFHETPNMDAKNTLNCFTEGRSLFYGEVMQYVISMRNEEVDFGIVPYPMYDANQGRYYALVNNIAHVVSIPNNVQNIEKSGMIVEAMAYKSQSTLTPAYYDVTLLAKGTRDEESGKMLDIILSNRIYDLGYVFGWGDITGKFYNVAKNGSSIATQIAKYQKAFDKQKNTTLKKYNK